MSDTEWGQKMQQTYSREKILQNAMNIDFITISQKKSQYKAL